MRSTIISLGLVMTLSTAATARTWYVPAEAPTIQAGIDSATAGDILEVACDTYYEHDIVLKSGVILRSETAQADCVTINAQGLGRVLFCDGVDHQTIVEGITITGGLADQGGGLYCTGGAEPHLVDCVISLNQADDGGGLYADSSAPSLSACLLTGNIASGNGGGIALRGSSGLDVPAIVNCTFQGNTAGGKGGGIYCRISLPTIMLCTLSDNSAGDEGGGIHFELASPNVVNTIIAFSENGEAVSMDVTSNPILFSCCLFGNAGGDWVGDIADQAGVDGNFAGDPGFCDRHAGNFTLCSDSWCLPGTLPNGYEHLLIGAHDQGCGPCGPHVFSEARTWGVVKAMYR